MVGVGAEGCHPAALFVYPDFLRDTHGCLAPQNEIARVHAQQLLALVNELGDLHPDATYTFLDLYGATLYVMDHADELGKAKNKQNGFETLLTIVVNPQKISLI